MTNNIQQTIKGVEQLKGELGAWESRLVVTKSEVESLKRQKETLTKDCEAIRSVLAQEIEKKNLETRLAAQKVEEDRKKLTSDQEEFKAMLVSFRQEKTLVDKEKEDAANTKANYTAMNEKIGNFLMFVRREAEKL